MQVKTHRNYWEVYDCKLNALIGESAAGTFHMQFMDSLKSKGAMMIEMQRHINLK